ncbi:disease resistance protein RLM3-like [Neltuma alba]|uniref:disease resistance protein RLM3-like n=1 Tax=Neltuma alba TaxID=207710 RepID=UPI0010A2E130|nr:disease resistance protein RLM3-like [Prosopis alba]
MISSSLGVRTLAPTSLATNIDCQPPKGHEISPSLLRAIEDSCYASSRLYSEVNGQIVIPVFYIVEPSHVRNQIRLYEQAFEKFERDLKDNQHKMQIWKQAFNEAANLAGDDSHTCR